MTLRGSQGESVFVVFPVLYGLVINTYNWKYCPSYYSCYTFKNFTHYVVEHTNEIKYWNIFKKIINNDLPLTGQCAHYCIVPVSTWFKHKGFLVFFLLLFQNII